MSAVVDREHIGFKSSVLLVGHPNPDQVAFGADFANSTKPAIEKLSKSQYPVVAIHLDIFTEAEHLDFYKKVSLSHPDIRHVLVTTKASPELP